MKSARGVPGVATGFQAMPACIAGNSGSDRFSATAVLRLAAEASRIALRTAAFSDGSSYTLTSSLQKRLLQLLSAKELPRVCSVLFSLGSLRPHRLSCKDVTDEVQQAASELLDWLECGAATSADGKHSDR